MAEPVIERIAQNVVDTLKGVNVAAGYNNSLSVERLKREGNAPRDLLVVVEQHDETQPEDVTHNKQEWFQRFAVTCYVVEQDGARSLDTRINSVRADVQKALMQDPHRGDLAIDTILRGCDSIALLTGGQLTGIVVYFDVHYAVEWDDPCALASV